jgi:hypothetical protein
MKRWWHSNLVRSVRLARCPAIIWFGLGSVYLFLEWVCRHFEAPPGAIGIVEPSSNPLREIQAKAVDVAAAAFGLYRALAFHPYARVAYRKWLTSTCWHSGRPLPLGPVALTIGDLLTLALGMLLVWSADPRAWTLAVPCIFAAGYLLATAGMLLLEGPRAFGYAVLCGLGGMLMFASRLEFALPIAAATYAVAWSGTRRSLARLPMYEPRALEKVASPTASAVDRIELRPLSAGWPFGPLCPKASTSGLPRFDAICISLVIGWVLFCAATLSAHLSAAGIVTGDDRPLFLTFAPIVCLIACFIRMTIYMGGYRPPIGLAGRIATGRWIIPSYDRALVAPLLGLLIVAATSARNLSPEAQTSIVELPLEVTAVFLVVLLSGPNFRDWALTSECRIMARRPQPQQNNAASLTVSP